MSQGTSCRLFGTVKTKNSSDRNVIQNIFAIAIGLPIALMIDLMLTNATAPMVSQVLSQSSLKAMTKFEMRQA